MNLKPEFDLDEFKMSNFSSSLKNKKKIIEARFVNSLICNGPIRVDIVGKNGSYSGYIFEFHCRYEICVDLSGKNEPFSHKKSIDVRTVLVDDLQEHL